MSRGDVPALRFLVVAGIGLLAAPWAPAGQAAAAAAKPTLAPQIETRAPDGRLVRLADFKGKVVLVDFWASWCGPCKTSFPVLDTLYRELHPRGLEVLAVNVDERSGDADEFLRARPHQMLVTFDPKGRAPEAFGVDSMPSSYLIDRQGMIRFTHTGFTAGTAAAYRREIDLLLAEPGPGADANPGQ